MNRHGQGTAGKYDCRCGYPASSAQDLDEHIVAAAGDGEQHGEQ